MNTQTQSRPLAVVTGAASGIGLAIATRLAEDGFEVIMLDRDGERLDAAVAGLGGHGHTVRGERLDLLDHARVERLCAELPPIDALVNNAGIFDVKEFLDLEVQDMRRMYEINLEALFVLSKCAVRRMRPGAKIINIASRAYLGARRSAHYSAAKAAVVGLTKAMALDLADRGILINAIAPGVIDTPILQAWPDAERAAMAKLQPLGRIGKPEDIANAVAFLAAPRTDFITGQVILVDGGRSVGGV